MTEKVKHGSSDPQCRECGGGALRCREHTCHQQPPGSLLRCQTPSDGDPQETEEKAALGKKKKCPKEKKQLSALDHGFDGNI